jgi:hypothetical protein
MQRGLILKQARTQVTFCLKLLSRNEYNRSPVVQTACVDIRSGTRASSYPESAGRMLYLYELRNCCSTNLVCGAALVYWLGDPEC